MTGYSAGMTRRRTDRDPSLVAMGAALKKRVAHSGKRQQDVATELGVGLRTFAGYLAGGGEIPISTVIALAPILDTTPEQLTAELANAALASHVSESGGSDDDVAETLRTVSNNDPRHP